MKFILLLLILTTLTAVALSGPNTWIRRIQSVENGEFWIAQPPNITLGLSGSVFELHGDSLLILDQSNGLAVQFNGSGNPVTLEQPDSNNVAQQWVIKLAAKGEFTICSKSFVDVGPMCISAPSIVAEYIVYNVDINVYKVNCTSEKE
ncbi:hypothetical protein RCL_jg22160.t2 [Rhizophagus clarus]|uniref:Ricin B lectin domain-containing protein n=1 Tax=Rhizophagus clarus TaxID=94130 RepID=A0A8H3QPR1_9GLOM|nr:hypothetical protein RCL_jg22160.t2 [Rhizophagus clarus]